MYLNFQIHPTQQKPVEDPLFSLLKVYIVDGFAHQWLPNFRRSGIRWPKGALCRCRSVRWGYPGYKGIGSAVGDVGGWTSTWFYLSVSSTSCGPVNHFYVNILVWVDSTGSVGWCWLPNPPSILIPFCPVAPKIRRPPQRLWTLPSAWAVWPTTIPWKWSKEVGCVSSCPFIFTYIYTNLEYPHSFSLSTTSTYLQPPHQPARHFPR